jgi:hypothetical protein
MVRPVFDFGNYAGRSGILASGLPPVDTLAAVAYMAHISLTGVAPDAHIISHVVKIQAFFIGPIL